MDDATTMTSDQLRESQPTRVSVKRRAAVADSLDQEPAFQDAVSRTVDMVKNHVNASLRFYWMLGGEAAAVDTAYGDGAIAKFAEAVSVRFPSRPVESTMVYRARQFHAAFGEEELEKLIASGMSWRAIIKLLPLEPDDRKAITAMVLAGNLTQDQIPAEANKLKEARAGVDDSLPGVTAEDGPTAREPGLSGAEMAKRFRAVTKIAEKAAGVMDAVEDLVNQFDGLVPDEQAQAREEASAALGKCDALHTKLTDAMGLLRQMTAV